VTISCSEDKLEIVASKDSEKSELPPPPVSLFKGMKKSFLKMASLDEKSMQGREECELSILKDGKLYRIRVEFLLRDNKEMIDLSVL
jgi:hypothetical protein